MAKYDYSLTEVAESDIGDVFEYIAVDLANPGAASAFADELEEKLDELCAAPKSGSRVENEYIKRDDVRRILVGNFIAYYIVDEEKERIVVLRVVYKKRDQNKILSDVSRK